MKWQIITFLSGLYCLTEPVNFVSHEPYSDLFCHDIWFTTFG
jgi:hypothetical protein